MAKLKVCSLLVVISAFSSVVLAKNTGNLDEKASNVVRTVNIYHTEGLETILMENFKDLTELITLNASNKHITEIEPKFFINASLIESADFSNNAIQRIESAFEDVINLKTLNLSNNKIVKFESDSFPVRNLVTLDLSNNKLTTLNKTFFERLTNLKHLNLSDNSIGKLEVQIFSHQKKLISLDLSKNNLITFDFHVFSPNLTDWHRSFFALRIVNGIQSLIDPYLNENLQSLDLSNNQLIEMNNFQSGNFSQLSLLDISGNEFNCSYLQIFLGSVRWGIDLHTNDSWQNLIEGDSIHGVHCKRAAINHNITTAESSSSSGSVSSDSIFLIEILLALLCICSTTVLIIILYLGRKQLFECCYENYKYGVTKNSKQKKIFHDSNKNAQHDGNKLDEVMPAVE